MNVDRDSLKGINLRSSLKKKTFKTTLKKDYIPTPKIVQKAIQYWNDYGEEDKKFNQVREYWQNRQTKKYQKTVYALKEFFKEHTFDQFTEAVEKFWCCCYDPEVEPDIRTKKFLIKYSHLSIFLIGEYAARINTPFIQTYGLAELKLRLIPKNQDIYDSFVKEYCRYSDTPIEKLTPKERNVLVVASNKFNDFYEENRKKLPKWLIEKRGHDQVIDFVFQACENLHFKPNTYYFAKGEHLYGQLIPKYLEGVLN